MKARRPRERVTFQRRSIRRNDFGEDIDAWSDIASTWASVEPLSAREFFLALQSQSDITLRVRCRYSATLAAVTTKDRIAHGARRYDIRSVIDPGNRHRELELLCTQHL